MCLHADRARNGLGNAAGAAAASRRPLVPPVQLPPALPAAAACCGYQHGTFCRGSTRRQHIILAHSRQTAVRGRRRTRRHQQQQCVAAAGAAPGALPAAVRVPKADFCGSRQSHSWRAGETEHAGRALVVALSCSPLLSSSWHRVGGSCRRPSSPGIPPMPRSPSVQPLCRCGPLDCRRGWTLPGPPS